MSIFIFALIAISAISVTALICAVAAWECDHRYGPIYGFTYSSRKHQLKVGVLATVFAFSTVAVIALAPPPDHSRCNHGPLL